MLCWQRFDVGSCVIILAILDEAALTSSCLANNKLVLLFLNVLWSAVSQANFLVPRYGPHRRSPNVISSCLGQCEMRSATRRYSRSQEKKHQAVHHIQRGVFLIHSVGWYSGDLGASLNHRNFRQKHWTLAPKVSFVGSVGMVKIYYLPSHPIFWPWCGLIWHPNKICCKWLLSAFHSHVKPWLPPLPQPSFPKQ